MATSTTTVSGGSGGGPAPFLIKTYEMVDDSTTDDIVSWSPSHTSFIVWNIPEFCRLLLPSFFKHSNFSSFVRQLNTYGFRKIDPERWEFANEDFIKGKKHLLKNIHRKKPVHSHSQPPPDPERAAYEEEIEKLSRENKDLDIKVSDFKVHHSKAKSQLEDITQCINGMEKRQEKLLTYLQKALENTAFLEHLAQKIDLMDFTTYNKKRRFPRSDTDRVSPALENKIGDIFQQDMSNKLKLELSTTVSNMNMVSNNDHSSNKDWENPTKEAPWTEAKDMEICTVSSFQQNLVIVEESESSICCQLNLSLASSIVQPNQSSRPRIATNMDVDVSGSQGTRPDTNGSDKDGVSVVLKNNHLIGNVGNSSSQETRSDNQDQTRAVPARVNDQFWEQFLTERPGSSDTEEASSSYKSLPSDEREDRGSTHGMSRTAKNLGKLTL